MGAAQTVRGSDPGGSGAVGPHGVPGTVGQAR